METIKSIQEQIFDEIKWKSFPDVILLQNLFDLFFENNLFLELDDSIIHFIATKRLKWIYEYLFQNGYIIYIESSSYKNSQNCAYVYYSTYEFLFQEKIFEQKIVFSKYHNQIDISNICSIYNSDYLNMTFNKLHPLNKKRFIIYKIQEFNNNPDKYTKQDIINFIDLLIENNLHIFFILLLEHLPLNDYNIKNYVIHYLHTKMQLYAFKLNTLFSDYLEFDIVRQHILNREHNNSYFANVLINHYKFAEQIEKDKLFLKEIFVKSDLVFQFISLIGNINIYNSLIKNTNSNIYIKSNLMEKNNKVNAFHLNEKFIIFEFFKIFFESDFDESIIQNIDNSIFNSISKKDIDILKNIIIKNKEILNIFIKYRILFDEEFILKYNIENF